MRQSSVIYLLMMAPLIQQMTRQIIYVGIYNKVSCDVSGCFCKNWMAFNLTKTKCMLMATRQKHQKKQIPLNLKFVTTPTEHVSKHRLLGVTVDEQLKWQTHINNICRTVSRNIFLFSNLSQIVSQKSKLAFFFAHIMSHMNYVSNAWDGCAGVHSCAAVVSPQTCHKIIDAYS